MCPADHVALLTADELKQFTAANYTAPRVVVAGAGMAHDALVNLATPLFEGMAGGSASEPVSKYVGGDWRYADLVLLRTMMMRLHAYLTAFTRVTISHGDIHCLCIHRQYSPSPLTHAVLAFEFAGGWKDVKGATAVTVLQYLLGGGGSFSAGGPGTVAMLAPC